ncbi:MAG: glycosyltransferase family 39 protein [Anaerolineae bacterium]|jgi:4-amino-4-deoxy-L-arabinose transferase-like glycosyltransferase|nr:glycosyltransferase family 39 protein [Anaerolineae bacterium]
MAYAVRVLSLEAQGLWRDEVDILNFSTAPWLDLLARLTRPGENGPLYLLIMRGWIALTGESVFALRFFSLLFGVLGVALIYRLGCRVVGRRGAAWAAVLAAFSPYFVWYAEEVKMYTWVPFLVLLALYVLDRACARPRWGWWAVVVVATSFAFYSHILAALLIPVEILWFLLHPRRDRRAWRGGLLALALLTLPYLPLLKWQAGLAFTTRQTGFPDYTFGQMAQMLLGGWSTGITGWGLTAGAAIFGGFAAGGLGALVWQRKWRTACALLAWVVVPLVSIWVVSLRGPIFTDRYLIWAAPAFYFAIATALAFLEQRLQGVALVCFAVLLTFSGGNLYYQVATPVKPQFREAAAFLAQRRDPEALLLFQIPYNRIVVDYYLSPPLEPWAEAPYTNWPAENGGYLWNSAEVDAAMQSLTTGYRQLWLVYSEAGMWDERELVKTWLDTHMVLRESMGFHNVGLYRYELPAP